MNWKATRLIPLQRRNIGLNLTRMEKWKTKNKLVSKFPCRNVKRKISPKWDDVNWWRQSTRAAKLRDYWTVNREDLGTRLNCFGSEYKTADHLTRFTKKIELGELLAKNMTRTARRQLDGRLLLFGEYLQNWTTLYLLNLPINMHYQRWT